MWYRGDDASRRQVDSAFMIAPVIGNFVFATALNKISYQIYEDTVVYKRVADYGESNDPSGRLCKRTSA